MGEEGSPARRKTRESESYILSKTMPRPYSAEAAVKFYNRGVEGLGNIHLQTWPRRSTPKSERKSKKRAEETAVKTERAKKAWRPCMQQRKRKNDVYRRDGKECPWPR